GRLLRAVAAPGGRARATVDPFMAPSRFLSARSPVVRLPRDPGGGGPRGVRRHGVDGGRIARPTGGHGGAGRGVLLRAPGGVRRAPRAAVAPGGGHGGGRPCPLVDPSAAGMARRRARVPVWRAGAELVPR